MPSGTVRFLDEGIPIGSCASQPLTVVGSSLAASCTLSYPAAGAHNITAGYAGDLNFSGSTSPSQSVVVPPEEHQHEKELEPKSKVELPILGARQTAGVVSGVARVRLKGTTRFVALSTATSVPDGSEIDATNGHVLISAATRHGGTVSCRSVWRPDFSYLVTAHVRGDAFYPYAAADGMSAGGAAAWSRGHRWQIGPEVAPPLGL